MRRLVRLAAIAAVALGLPSGAAGQLSLVPHAGAVGVGAPGSLAVGADLATSLGGTLVLRGGFDAVSLEPERTAGGLSWQLTLPSIARAVVDWHPGASDFRVSAGALLRTGDVELIHDAGGGDVPVGSGTYRSSDVGILVGDLEQSPISPYVGVGWGRATAPGAGLFVEAGVGLGGSATATLAATGSGADDADFQADLERERTELEDDLGSTARVWTFVSVGLRIGF